MVGTYRTHKDIHPAPYDDGIPMVGWSDRFAFESPGALLRWFGQPAIMSMLEKLGYVVALVAVPRSETRIGKNQATYDMRHVLRVETITFDKLVAHMID